MSKNQRTASKKRTIYIVTEQEQPHHHGGQPRRIPGVFGSQAKAIRAFCSAVNFTIRTEAQDAAREALRTNPLMKAYHHPFSESFLGKCNDWNNPWFTSLTCKMETSAMSIRYAPEDTIHTRLYAVVDVDVRCPAVSQAILKRF